MKKNLLLIVLLCLLLCGCSRESTITPTTINTYITTTSITTRTTITTLRTTRPTTPKTTEGYIDLEYTDLIPEITFGENLSIDQYPLRISISVNCTYEEAKEYAKAIFKVLTDTSSATLSPNNIFVWGTIGEKSVRLNYADNLLTISLDKM